MSNKCYISLFLFCKNDNWALIDYYKIYIYNLYT